MIGELGSILASIAIITIAYRQALLARALREQAEMTTEAFRSLAYLAEQLNASPSERFAMHEAELTKLRTLLSVARLRERRRGGTGGPSGEN